MPPPAPSQRFHEIDVLRTVAIVLMVAYHTAYDLRIFHGWDIAITSGPWLFLQRLTASLFIGIVGASFVLSREKMLRRHTTVKTMTKRWAYRVAVLFVSAMLVTIVTYFFDPVLYVRFGVLHLIAAVVFLLPLFARFDGWNMLLGVALIIPAYRLGNVHADSGLLVPLGITPEAFSTMDYFPLIPWLGVALFGAGLSSVFYVRESSVKYRWDGLRLRIDAMYRQSALFRALTVPGKHSLVIYLLHQPILIGALRIILQ